MWFKLLMLGLVAFGIYAIFFSKNKKINADNDTKGNKSGGRGESDLLTMVECQVCKTYIAKSEAISKGEKHFCSLECVNNGGLK